MTQIKLPDSVQKRRLSVRIRHWLLCLIAGKDMPVVINAYIGIHRRSDVNSTLQIRPGTRNAIVHYNTFNTNEYQGITIGNAR